MFGNYRQCLGIRAYEDDEELDDDFFNDGTEPKKPVEKKEFFRGKYCILGIYLKPFSTRFLHSINLNSFRNLPKFRI